MQQEVENKSEGKQESGRDRVLQALDHFTKDKKDLEEKIIEPAKERIDEEVKKLDEMKQELIEKKEKLNEFKGKEVDEPIKNAGEQYIERLKENASPEKLISRLGYNIQKQHPDSHEPESVTELMKAKNDLKSGIEPRPLLKKKRIDIGKKMNNIDDFGITRKVTADPGEEQVQV